MHDNIEGCNQLLATSVSGERCIQPARRFLEVHGIRGIAREEGPCDIIEVSVWLYNGCVVTMTNERAGEESGFETPVSA